jgi:hypothetical protein
MTRQEWQRAISEAYRRAEADMVREWRIAEVHGYVRPETPTPRRTDGISVVRRRILPRFD